MSRNFIKTFLRVRPDARNSKNPSVPFEIEHDFEKSSIKFHVDRRNLKEDVVNHSIEDFAFQFNRVLDQKSTQEQVFEAVGKDAVQNVLNGFNATVFAYGQTSSGKTYSTTGGTGSRAERGLIPRAISMIYEEIQKCKEYHFTVGISYLQIYNDKGSDLLNRGDDAKSLDDLPSVTVYETDDDVILKGLECHPSASVEEALNLLFLGDTNRLYCETPMNKTSSRSHCIFTVALEARLHGSAVVRRSKLNLVDLAGSERVGRTGVTGNMLNEAKYINLSLHYLEHVIVALSEKRDHVPYRNSMMTMVLRDSLGGNCRTVMLATAHPGFDQFWETLSTCRFAQRVASIHTKSYVIEETDPLLLVRQLKKEVAALKEQVAFLSGGKDTDPRRQLPADEMERCRDLVRRFLEDPECDALVGAGSDMARIAACFNIMRDAVNKKGGKVLAETPAPAASRAQQQQHQQQSEQQAIPTISPEQEQLLREEVRRLKTSLQMKENEMTLLFDLVQRHNNESSGNNNLRESIAKQASGITSGRNGDGSSTPPPYMQQQQQKQQQQQQQTAAVAPTPPMLREQQQQQQSEGDYNLNALSDPELLKDRTTAFEAFRRSYRKQEQMNGCHQELEQRITGAKALAVEINAVIEKMKAAKARVQQMRAERALQEDPEKVDPEEAALLGELQGKLRPQWNQTTEALKGEKEKIQHLQLIIKRSQEQLIRDFEGWFNARQTQISAAMTGSGSNNNNNNAGAAAAAAASSSSSRSNISSSVIKPLVQQASALNQQQPVQQQQQHLSSSSNSAAKNSFPPHTGNPQVDAELQRMYQARESLKAKLAASMQ